MSKTHRNYLSASSSVEKTYLDMFQHQTLEYVNRMKKKYCSPPFYSATMETMMRALDHVTDESDPDTDLSQMIHAYQTAESLQERYLGSPCSLSSLFTPKEWENLPFSLQTQYDTTLEEYAHRMGLYTYKEWLPLVGFIHDTGKVLMLPELGSLPQWSVVGDTFPLGVSLSPHFPFATQSHAISNSSLQDSSSYPPHCGFDRVTMSWGHDEYLASVLERHAHKQPKSSNILLPSEAIYIIRYHSFYAWHTPRGEQRSYLYLANKRDWDMLPWLKAFQKADLYSKSRVIPSSEKQAFWYNVMKKYFPSFLEW